MEDGIYSDLSIEDYHENKTHISATQIKYARESLKHFEWFISGKLPQEEKQQFGFGNAFELALMASDVYLKKVAVMPENDFIAAALEEKPDLTVPRNSKKFKTERDQWLTANQGKYIISDTGDFSFEAIEEMLSSCYQDKVIQALIKNTEYQLSLFWTDPETGVKLKTRPDFCKRKKNVLVNIKTTADGSPEAFSKDLKKWDYPIQAAIEIQGALNTGLMDRVDTYFWLVVEHQPPFNATIYEFQETDIAAVTDTLFYLLNKIKKGQDQGLWPGYSDQADNEHGILRANIPLWYKF